MSASRARVCVSTHTTNGKPPDRLALAAFNVGQDILSSTISQGECCSAEGIKAPSSYHAAMASVRKEEWLKVMHAEHASLIERGVFQVTLLPPDSQTISCMWIFSLKTRADRTMERYKAWLVAKGFSQRPGIEFSETWAPTGRSTILRALFAPAARFDWEI
jgi:hypothetical protein